MKTIADVQAAAAELGKIEAEFQAKLKEIQAQRTGTGPYGYILRNANLFVVPAEYVDDARILKFASYFGYRVAAMP